MCQKGPLVWTAWSILLGVVMLGQAAVRKSFNGAFAVPFVTLMVVCRLWCCSVPKRTDLDVPDHPVPGDESETNNANGDFANRDGLVRVGMPDTKDVESVGAERMDTTAPDDQLHNNGSGGTVTPSGSSSPRVYFLDNVKSFLTFLVVNHHCFCAFGGCGPRWMLIVGMYPNSFTPFGLTIASLHQSFFMSLFFFISAYFVPRSYEKKGGRAFLMDKAKRLLLPLLFVTYIFSPLNYLYGFKVAGDSLRYVPVPGHTWFLEWLLILNVVYSTVAENSTSTWSNIAFPVLWKRLAWGVGICGIAMFAVVVILSPSGGSFLAMPLAVGSLASDLLFFCAGIVAQRSRWLIRPIREQLGIRISLLWVFIVLEATAIMAMVVFRPTESTDPGISALAYLGYYIVAGLLCVDLSIGILDLFQTYADYTNSVLKFLSDAAYTVYIIHPIVVMAATHLFVKVYEWTNQSKIQFVEDATYSEDVLVGPDNGSLWIFGGWISTVVLSQLIVWPLGWAIKQLPLLRGIL